MYLFLFLFVYYIVLSSVLGTLNDITLFVCFYVLYIEMLFIYMLKFIYQRAELTAELTETASKLKRICKLVTRM